MLEGKRIYVSDVHMGPKKDPQSQYDYTWLGTAEAKVFAEFLGYLNADEEVKEVILLGDTMVPGSAPWMWSLRHSRRSLTRRTIALS